MVSKAHCVSLVPDRDQHSKHVPLFLNNVLLLLALPNVLLTVSTPDIRLDYF